jgi:ABC-type multidrug transport system ATPase subunit
MTSTNLIISIQHAGKKFGTDWIFRKLDLEIKPLDKIAILGLNGSGKSTLLQALSGYLTLNEGTMSFTLNGQPVDSEIMYRYCSYASPYLELIEDFTLAELVTHTSVYKPFINTLSVQHVIELSGLSEHQHKFIHQFSSGMKQRLKLTLAILADTPILLLDEPTSNLDVQVIQWYQTMIQTYAQDKTIIVCSNSIKEEYHFCSKTILMEDYKPIKKTSTK